MHSDLSIASLILGASLLVKFVMLILVIASVASWALIFSKRREMRGSSVEETRQTNRNSPGFRPGDSE